MAKIMTAQGMRKMRILRPGKRQKDVRDGGAPGLYVRVETSGAMSWHVLYRRANGKQARLRLGAVNPGPSAGPPVIGAPLTIAEARQLCNEVHSKRAAGRDPAAERMAEKRRTRLVAIDGAARTFAVAARAFCDNHQVKRKRRRPRRWRETAAILGLRYDELGEADPVIVKGGLAQRWVDRTVADITQFDLRAIVIEARDRGIPGTERRNKKPSRARERKMHAALSGMFRWLVRDQWITANPIAGLEPPDAPEPRHRFLKDHEIVVFWKACDTIGSPFGQLLRLLLLTGCRLSEVAGMRRSELDGATWTIPGERSKNDRPHALELPPLALSIIGSVPRMESEAGLIFTTTGRTPVSGFSRMKRQLDKAMTDAVPPWSLHDLRRTFSTHLNEDLQVPSHVVEACLNHRSGTKAGVAGTYNQATYAAERRTALERWADHVEGMVTGRKARVLNIRARASK